MIHASAAKLNQYSGDTYYDMVMAEITAAQDEGLTSFEVDISKLDRFMVFDISRALTDLGYVVDLDEDRQLLEVAYDE